MGVEGYTKEWSNGTALTVMEGAAERGMGEGRGAAGCGIGVAERDSEAAGEEAFED